MANHFLREHDLPHEQLLRELDAVFAGPGDDWFQAEQQHFRENTVLTGRVLRVTADTVFVDIGFKSEGAIGLREWYDERASRPVPPRPGDDVPLLLESLEDDTGVVVLSYRRARAQGEWDAFLASHRIGDVVRGRVARKVKGGLLIDIGVSAFLPSSQLDLRRVPDIGRFIGQEVECQVLAIDEARQNVVVSRRALLEAQRDRMKKELLAAIEPGQLRTGVVKNITSFGAFIDLGGAEGLLHVTQMSWRRVKGPHEVVHLDQQLEVVVLGVDREQGRIALGLKQKAASPWDDAASKYPVGSRHVGEVVNVTSYGAFIELGPGLDGLLHVSEFDEAEGLEDLAAGDKVEVKVLRVDAARRKIALSRRLLDRTAPDQPGLA